MLKRTSTSYLIIIIHNIIKRVHSLFGPLGSCGNYPFDFGAVIVLPSTNKNGAYLTLQCISTMLPMVIHLTLERDHIFSLVPVGRC